MSDIDYPSLLKTILDNLGCQTGTIHQTTDDGENLALVCQIGVPDFLLDQISSIPFGKGIAGAAAERKEAVELCNLQQDLGGVANPDAQKTGVAGSIAVPIFSKDATKVIGTLGIGKFTPHEFTDSEKQQLRDCAKEIAENFLGRH
jgi:L-methionine (R)-S-oxide reductase